jgi:hypothetical protein
MTDYPQWPFEVSQIDRGDRALRELFGTAYYPGLVREGEPASGERQAFVPGAFGNIFDVLVTDDSSLIPPVRRGVTTMGASPKNEPFTGPGPRITDSYAAIVLGGRIELSILWAGEIGRYVRDGGTLVVNAAQAKGLPTEFLGVRLTGQSAEADDAKCLAPNEPPQNLRGNLFRFQQVELKGAQPFLVTGNNEPLVTINRFGRGKVIFVALPDLLGEDERLTPFVAHLLAHVTAEITPVKVDGDVEYLVNRNAKGWVVTLFNDNGVFKPQQGLAQVDRSAEVTVTLSLRRNSIVTATDWLNDRALDINRRTGSADTVTLKISAGGVAVVELGTAR